MALPVIILHPAAAYCDGIAQALDRRRFKHEDLASYAEIPSLLDREDPVAVIVRVDRKSLWDHLARFGEFPWATVIALVSADDPWAYVRALRLGADGVVEATAPVVRVIAVMEAALAGDVVLTRAAASRIVEGARFDFEVSERDLRILQALADTKTMAEVAREEHVSYSTVRRLVRDLPNKLGVGHIQAAIAKASTLGLIGAGSDRTDDPTAAAPAGLDSVRGCV
jgi:DNA-binding NarL/FixJ family response regulator